MKTQKSFFFHLVGKIALAVFMMATFTMRASTIWNGPNIGFFHPFGGGADQMTTNVSLSRGSSGGLYNTNLESGALSGTSPKGTLWAVGTLSQFTNGVVLSFGACPLEQGNNPPSKVGTTYVVHLITNDVYLELTLTNWGGAFGAFHQQTFGYTRSTPATVVASTPSVTITNPVTGAVFAAPANVTIQASATNSSGAVTNVQFFTNNVSIGSVVSAPFNFTANNLPAGNYALKAVAASGGINGTSAVVNIVVDAPPAVNITSPTNTTTLSAPANVTVHVSATDSDGSVTNVQLFVGPNILTNSISGIFSATTNNLAAGSYTLSAVALDNLGVKNTNSISLNVVTPVTNTVTGTVVSSPGTFQFNFAANAGLSYILQVSTNLASTNWLTLATNTASGGTVTFTDNHATNNSGYYRVGRLPNP